MHPIIRDYGYLKNLASNGLLIDDICLYSRCFTKLHNSHKKRECNKIAYSLVRYALYISDFVVWMKDVLPQAFSIF